MHLYDLLNIAALHSQVQAGAIRAIPSPDDRHTLYCYTAETAYRREWTPEAIQCRGLIVESATGTVVARPFDKFFNLGELVSDGVDLSLASLVSRPGPVELTEKRDGSLIICWWDAHYEVWRLNTKGSWGASQIRAADAWLTKRLGKHWMQQLPAVLRDTTLLFEYTGPDNQIVVPYANASLTLIGARSLTTGSDATHAQLVSIGAAIGVPIVTLYSDKDVIGAAAESILTKGVEGWVARWPDGSRVKIKTDEYVQLHWMVSHFSPGAVQKSMLEERYDDMVAKLPDAYRTQAQQFAEAIHAAWDARLAYLHGSYERLKHLLEGDDQRAARKRFALAVVAQYPKADQAFLFCLSKNEPISLMALEYLDINAIIGSDWQLAPVDEERLAA